MHIGDCVYFGHSTTFASVAAIVSTAGSTGVLVWEYGTGHDTWATCTGTVNSFTATGGQAFRFTNEAIPSAWIQTEVNSITKYWMRARIATAYVTTVPILTQARRDGHVATYLVATAAADAGTNPYTDATAHAGAASTTNLSACQLAFGAALNMGTGIILGTIRSTLPRDAAVDIALPSKIPGGIQVCFFDTTGYYLCHKIGAKGCKTLDLAGRNVWAIDWNGSAIPWATCGSINKSAVTRMYMSSYGYYGAAAFQWSMLCLVVKIGIAGGTSAYPLDLTDIVYAANNSCGMFPFIIRAGAAATIYAPLQLGGGDPVRIYCNLNTFQFPTCYDGVDYFDWNAATNVAGINFYPKSGDVLKFTNCVFTSESSYRWYFDASSASSGWTGDFSGTSVVNASVVLRAVFVFNLMSFISCSSFTQNGATITNTKFTNTKVTAATPADAALISSSTFTSGGTGYGLEIGGTAANITLTGNTWVGYAASDGSSGNEAIYVNIASGSMTITISGGTNPSIRTAGATVTKIVNPVTTLVHVTDMETGSHVGGARVLVKVANGTNFPYNITVTITSSGTTATVTHTSHGMATNDKVVISGASPDTYNGAFTITYIGVNSYSYVLPTTATSPATGTIKCTMALIIGCTNTSGEISDIRSMGAHQAVEGWVRRATYGPSYTSGTWTDTTSTLTKTGAFTGQLNQFVLTITSGTNMTPGEYIATYVSDDAVTLDGLAGSANSSDVAFTIGAVGYYRQQPISDTVDKDYGKTINIQLVPDS
jgi:hypothetical protein